MANQSPEKVFRMGLCSVSLFRNLVDGGEGRKRVMWSVVPQRRYQDDKGEWQSATSLNFSDLPVMQHLLQQVLDYVGRIEGEESDS